MAQPIRTKLRQAVQTVNASSFETVALTVFRYQAKHNPLYARFLSLLGRPPARVQRLADIPFLPISFFKTHLVQTGHWTPATVFTSSGTTGQIPSQHRVPDLNWYHQNTLRGFQSAYGDPADWLVLALLPSYLERSGSSLVSMADFFIRRSRHTQSGFFLHDLEALQQTLHQRPVGVPTLLLGVSFALLDLAETYPQLLGESVVVMETGGMKGKRPEITREALHAVLKEALGVSFIHSEYGMTELLSQAYAYQEAGRFVPAPTLRAFTMETNDPFCRTRAGRVGVLNLIDLANVDTCSFIATEDIGKVQADGTFEVLGRLDTAELRGCNLLVEG